MFVHRNLHLKTRCLQGAVQPQPVDSRTALFMHFGMAQPRKLHALRHDMIFDHSFMLMHQLDEQQHLPNIVEVTVGRGLLRQELLVCVHHHVQVELLLQQHQPVEAEAAHRPHRLDLQHPARQRNAGGLS